jgi:hypothetical protein
MSNDTNDNSSRDDNSVTTSLPGGGGVKIQFGGQTDLHAEVPPAEGMEVGAVRSGETLRMNPHTNELESLGGVTKYSTADRAPASDTDIASTARTAFGSPASEITPKTIVTVPGFGEMEVRVAVSLGYLRKTGEGIYATTGKHVADREALAPGKA